MMCRFNIMSLQIGFERSLMTIEAIERRPTQHRKIRKFSRSISMKMLIEMRIQPQSAISIKRKRSALWRIRSPPASLVAREFCRRAIFDPFLAMDIK